ncbi:FxDxF family PEP-CTERM protein [Sphingorhabdus sp.]|uniref:FxDxF family PEP-CTERM protein n=1 Tax=Sphingorhabdus sp. TaxID=1902408 RepID=UPI00391AB37B
MSIWKKAAVGAAVASAMFATSAQAAQFLTITGPSGTFGDDSVTCAIGSTAPCSFTRSFEFITPAGFNLTSVDISSIATTNPLTNIDFSSVTLNGINFNTVATGTQEFRNLLNQSLVAGGNNVLNVTGTSGGNAAFSGNLSFSQMAAVPEPTTWMLMLMGMAGIGFSMRRKKDTTLRVRFA